MRMKLEKCESLVSAIGNTKKIVLVLFAVIAVGVATAVATFQVQSQKDAKGQEQATVIQEGQMTEKQRQHSKLFKHSGPKLRDIAARQNGDVEVEEGVGLMMRLPATGTQRPVFHSAVCNADAVVIGILNDKSSQLTDGKNFVFTDYQITVEEIIKDNAVAPIPTASVITGTRDGGAIELNNRIFWAKREDFDPPIVGRRYLLFLRFIPATGAYLMYGNGSFQLAGQRVLALGPASRDEVTKGGVEDSLAFLNQIRTYAGKRTHSLVMTSESKHIRFVDSIHIEGVRGAGTNLYSHFRTGRVQDWNEGSRFKWNNSRYQQLSETENTRQARTKH